MRAQPARRIGFSALCAVLLTGITGPVAMAADSAPEPGRVVSPDTLLVEVRHLDARGGDLAPVADLLNAVLTAENGQLPPAEGRRLGAAAKKAVDRAIAKGAAEDAPEAPATMATATPSASATPEATPEADLEADLEDNPLDPVQEALDELLDQLLPDDEDDTDPSLPSLEDLLAEVDELLDALDDGDVQTSVVVNQSTTSGASPSPSPSASASTLPLFPGITALAPLTPLTSVLLPAS